MKLKVLSSGSSGNCYILENENEALIIEAGVHLNKVKQVLCFKINKVSGVLISHAHGDHAGKASDFEKIFPVYASEHVIEAKSLKRAKAIKPDKGYVVGGFKVLPFEAYHDVPCLGFLVNHAEFGNLLFLTDSGSCDYKFENLNHLLIECNYATSVLEKTIESGKLHPSVANRVVGSHMELHTCRDVLMSQDLSRAYNIILIHLSQNNSDEKLFTDTLSRATGKPILIAKPGLEVELLNRPY